MKSIKFTEKIEIASSVEFAFDYTQDYDQRLKWDTFLKEAKIIDGDKKAAKGVKAYCVAKNGLGMVTEYISYNGPKSMAIKMTKGPYLFKTFLASWSFKKIDDKLVEVIFLYSFKLRFPFNFIPHLIKRNIQNNVKQRLIDLKSNIEM